MVIECPNCVTKFAVDAQQLADVERPRFHCSRCDHFFELNDVKEPENANSTESQEESDRQPHSAQAEREQQSHTSQGEIEQLTPPSQGETNQPALTSQGTAEQQSLPSLTDQPLVTNDNESEDLDEDSFSNISFNEADPDYDEFDFDGDDFDDEIENLVASAASVVGSDTKEIDDSQSRQEYSAKEFKEDQPWVLDAGDDSATQLALYNEPAVDSMADMNSEVSGSRFRTNHDIENAPPLLAQWPEGDTTSAYEADTAAILHSEPQAKVERSTSDDTSAIGNITSQDFAVSEDLSEMDDTVILDPTPKQSQHIDDAMVADRSLDEDTSNTINEKISDWMPSENDLPDQGQSRDILSAEPKTDFRSSWPTEEPKEKTADIDEPREEPSDSPAQGARSSESSIARLPEAFDGEQEKRNRKLQRAADIRKQRLEKERQEALEEVGLLSGGTFVTDAQRSRNARSFITPLLLIWSVPALLVWGFSSWSKHTSDSPELISNLLHFESDNLPLAPPPGLALVDVNSVQKTLHDGSRILEIGGKVFNATERPYEDIKLEAKVFDLDNREISSQIVLFNNGLRRAKLPALSKSAILSLQKKRNSGTYDLAPGQTEPFRVVFTEVLGQEHWFSTRVYSVRQSKS